MRGRSQRCDTPSEVRFPGRSKLPIWPSGSAGKETGALPTQNQPGQEALNMAEFDPLFSNDGLEKNMYSLLNKARKHLSHERWMTLWEADVANLTANFKGKRLRSFCKGPFILRWRSEAWLQHENLNNLKDWKRKSTAKMNGVGVGGRAPSEGQLVKEPQNSEADTPKSRMTKPDFLLLICILSNLNETAGHLSWHGCHGNGSIFQMFLEGSTGFFGCLFIWTTAKSHFWNQTQFIYVLIFFPVYLYKERILQTALQIHKSKDGKFPSISLNLTCLYSNSLTFSTAIKVFSFNGEMLYVQCFCC